MTSTEIDQETRNLLKEVFDHVREHQLPDGVNPSEYETWKLDFVFHLTDWVSDLEELRGLLQTPKSFGVEDASHIITRFLDHAIPHLNAAGRLLLDEISDPFSSMGRAGPKK